MKTFTRLLWGCFTGSLSFTLHAAPLGATPEVNSFVLPVIESTLPVPSVVITPNPSFPNAFYYAYGSPRAVGVGDFNGDGLPDIAFAPGVVIHRDIPPFRGIRFRSGSARATAISSTDQQHHCGHLPPRSASSPS